MRTAGLFAFVALLGLKVAAFSAPKCHTDYPLPDDASVKEEIITFAQNNVTGSESVCNFPESYKPDGDSGAYLIARMPPFVFEISGTSDVQPTKDQCLNAFTATLEECIKGKAVFGGSVFEDGLEYELYPH